MGSGEASNKVIDASVGGLVWVRRRNGSWWPGRILGLNEVSESCVVSPRSGTPVKLLGREDASVDWYNLEKSKRVKAFRCGEYDDCIEKAKASAANSNKKAVKYARREDAIIHALEIENSRLGKDRTDIGTRADGLGQKNGSSARESLSVSRSGNQSDGVDDEVSDSEKNSDSAQELSQSGISFEEPNHISSSSKVRSMQGRRRTPNDSEDDGTEGVKRMRGLEDLGIGVASKRKAMAGGLLELVQQDNATLCDSNNLNSLSNGNTVNGNRGGSSLRRKRTQVVANANEFTKKKNRRRPLTKVLESTPMVPVVACDQLPSSRGPPPGVSNGKVSGLESIESKRSISGAINNNADCNGVSHENGTSLNVSEPACDTSDINMTKENEISSTSGSAENGSTDRLSEVPLVREEKQSQGPSPVVVDSSSDKPQVGGIKRQSSQSEGVSLKNERINETGSTSSEAVDPYIGRRLEKGTSKWQLKGKRNSRKISRNRNQDSRKYVDMDDERNACLAGLEHSDGLLSRGSDKKFDCDGVNVSPGSLDSALLTRSKPVEDGHEGGSKSLIKHPSQAEPNTSELGSDMKFLTDSSVAPQRLLPHRQSRFAVHSRYRISDSSPKESDSSLYDVKVEVNANHRSPHVPLVSFMSKLNGKAIVGHPITVELLEEGFCDELLSTMEDDLEGSHTGHVKRGSVKGRVPKHLVLQPPPPQSLRKSPKAKKPGLSPKKIRKLSSLNKKSEERKTVVEKPKGPVIACIPIKLVFSRINEAVNGSARQMHRV